MHKAGESERWMERPLSPQLLQYSANDIYLIATAFTFFEDNGWILPDLSAQSARYITPETSRERRDMQDKLGSNRFLPLGVLSDPASQEGPLYDCLQCGRSLDLTWENTHIQRETRRSSRVQTQSMLSLVHGLRYEERACSR